MKKLFLVFVLLAVFVHSANAFGWSPDLSDFIHGFDLSELLELQYGSTYPSYVPVYPGTCYSNDDCGISDECKINACIYDIATASRSCVVATAPQSTACGDGGQCDGLGNCLDAFYLPVIPEVFLIPPEPTYACDDSNACTLDYFDSAKGECSSTDLTGNSCGTGLVCFNGECIANMITEYCPDQDACTVDVFYTPGFSMGCDLINMNPNPRPQINCEDLNPDTIDSCNPSTGCVHAPKEQIPEFTYLGALIGLIGAAGLFVLIRRT